MVTHLNTKLLKYNLITPMNFLITCLQKKKKKKSDGLCNFFHHNFFLTKSKIYLLGRKYNENKLKEQKFVKINKSIKIK